ncbi:hypothetical protein BD310DRAFT_367823 [Dichomitus squalens]|uniref:Uncharacterized protein n=1 Tax=Dichomitus squalens TaxID=114155 RepID=A0A4Q9PBC5_9APHY|nr:hypothetical protein BD310DRAFT_367823 [Dichomitus squalens]
MTFSIASRGRPSSFGPQPDARSGGPVDRHRPCDASSREGDDDHESKIWTVGPVGCWTPFAFHRALRSGRRGHVFGTDHFVSHLSETDQTLWVLHDHQLRFLMRCWVVNAQPPLLWLPPLQNS